MLNLAFTVGDTIYHINIEKTMRIGGTNIHIQYSLVEKYIYSSYVMFKILKHVI